MRSARERWLDPDAGPSFQRRPPPPPPVARRVCVGIAAGEQDLAEPQLTAIVGRLAARGHAVELLDLTVFLRDASFAAEWLSEIDALVTRGRGCALRAVQRKAERFGVPVVAVDELPDDAAAGDVDARLADVVVARAFGAAANLTQP